MGKKITTEQFIERVIEIHGDKYDYNRVVYIHSKTKVEIYCKKCKEYFWQTPNSHLTTKGCEKCGIKKRIKNKTKTTEQFIIDAKKKHGDKYDYNRVVYIHSKTKVEIYCKKCKEYFPQTPTCHLHGQGCPICAGTKLKTKEQFIIDAKKVHSDKYGYDNVEYLGDDKPVEIYCKKHGSFWQTPNSHLSGCGCPICRESKGEIEVRKYLEKYGIKYVTQKTFDGCRNKSLLRFDFYLLDYNMCIEFQGKQHYTVMIGILNKNFTIQEQDDNLKRQQIHDQIKRDYCVVNNIKLIEIPYWDISNIDQILTTELL